MSVKDLVKQNAGLKPLDEKKPAGRRGSAEDTTKDDKTTEPPVPTQEAFEPTFTFGGGRERDNEWFLNREGELAVVTDQASNPALGIVNITAFSASPGQRAWGTIANITVELLIGEVTCQVVEDREHRGYLKVTTNYRKVEKDTKTDYYRDFTSNNVFRAQVLSWIYPQLKKQTK